MHRILLGLAAALVLATPVARAATTPDHLGEPSNLFTLPAGEGFILTAASDASGPRAMALFEQPIGHNVYEVAHHDADGRWRRFAISDPAVTAPVIEAVRFAPLEDGRELVAWDDGQRIMGQTWDRNGVVSAPRAILDGVSPVGSGDSDYAAWALVTDRRGTVVVASPAAASSTQAGVAVAVRDPGNDWFGAPQALSSPATSPYGTQVLVTPIADDGSVTVRWSTDSGATFQQATRDGRAATFGPVQPASGAPVPSNIVMRGQAGPAATVDGTAVTLGAAVAAHCPCRRIHELTWPDGTDVLVWDSGMGAGQEWWLARRSGGAFAHPERVSGIAAAAPVQLTTPGAIGLLRATSDTDYGLFRDTVQTFLVPFGHPRDTRTPTVRFGLSGMPHVHDLLVPVWCDEPCTVAGRSHGRALALRDNRGARRPALLEPNEVGWLLVRRPSGTVPVTVSATDLAGRRSRPHAARFGRYGDLWCRRGAPHGTVQGSCP